MRNKISILIIVFSLGLLVVNPVLVYAQQNSNTATSAQSPLPQYNAGVDRSISDYLCTPSQPADGRDLERCVNRLYRFSITVGGIMVVFFIVLAGYMYITGGESGKTKGKAMLFNALTGLGIILTSYVLLYFINPSLVVIKSIQPPIFKVGNLPSCAAVGFGEKCIVTTGPNSGSIVDGGVCAMPINLADARGDYNNTVHNPWDDDESTPDRHRTVRKVPNAPDPKGAVDVRMKKSGLPVYSPVSGTVELNRGLALGRYISISSTGTCSDSTNCVNIAHITPTVNPGDVIVAGQQVATITPNSGGLGPVMHIELKLGGQWILGDGLGKTWENMKSSISKCSSGGGKASNGFVVVKGIVIDMQYASASPTSYNLMKENLYTGPDAIYGTNCYLKPDVAAKVELAQKELEKLKPGWKIKAWDCVRPKAVQEKMYKWAVAKYGPKQGLVATPGSGQHPLGEAIDATLVNENGKDVLMPTHFDYYESDKKQDPRTNAYKNSAYKSNAEILKQIMNKAGLTRVCNEWWHFSSPGNKCSS